MPNICGSIRLVFRYNNFASVNIRIISKGKNFGTNSFWSCLCHTDFYALQMREAYIFLRSRKEQPFAAFSFKSNNVIESTMLKLTRLSLKALCDNNLRLFLHSCTISTLIQFLASTVSGSLLNSLLIILIHGSKIINCILGALCLGIIIWTYWTMLSSGSKSESSLRSLTASSYSVSWLFATSSTSSVITFCGVSSADNQLSVETNWPLIQTTLRLLVTFNEFILIKGQIFVSSF